MSIMSDFSSLMVDVEKCQAELVAVHEKLVRPEEKEMMGKLLKKIEAARKQAEQLVPDTLQQIRETAERNMAKAAQLQHELEQRKLQRKAAAAKLPVVTAPKKTHSGQVRVDPKLGPTLRAELLQRFGLHSESSERTAPIKEAWEDWL